MAWGLLTPAHLRAVDAAVLEYAGRNTAKLTEEGLKLLKAEKPGPARLVLKAAVQNGLLTQPQVDVALQNASAPKSKPWGGPAPVLDQVFAGAAARVAQLDGRPVMELLVTRDARAAAFAYFANPAKIGLREIVRTRGLTNLVHFSPAGSSSGQPYEAAIILSALLYDTVSRPLQDEIDSLTFVANRKAEVEKLELFYLDVLSLAKRLNWAQLTELLRDADTVTAVRNLGNLSRRNEKDLPSLYAAAILSRQPGALGEYLVKWGESGLPDVKYGLRCQQGGLQELLKRQQRVHYPGLRRLVASLSPVDAAFFPLLQVAGASPLGAIGIKYGLICLGAFLAGLAGARLAPLDVEYSERLFAAPQLALAGVLLVLTVVLCEPFLLQQSQTVDFPLHVRFPMVQGPVRAAIEKTIKPMIDTLSIASLLFFLVVQGTIFIACRRKLADIQRQHLPSKLKLKLIENEEHLFDAGLYCGFVGTVLALVFFSLGVAKPSLMAGYSSTSFGIIFVSILKIFYVRPYRRQLIIESESRAEAEAA
jgi:hypothetical protein